MQHKGWLEIAAVTVVEKCGERVSLALVYAAVLRNALSILYRQGYQ